MNELHRQLRLKRPVFPFGAAIALLLLAVTLTCLGCDEAQKGPSQAEVEAQRQAAVEKQRADAERARREAEEQRRQEEEHRRQESDQAAERFSVAALLGWAMLALFVGVLIGMSLGLRTRSDHAKQSRESGGQASARPGS